MPDVAEHQLQTPTVQVASTSMQSESALLRCSFPDCSWSTNKRNQAGLKALCLHRRLKHNDVSALDSTSNADLESVRSVVISEQEGSVCSRTRSNYEMCVTPRADKKIGLGCDVHAAQRRQCQRVF